MIYSWVCVFMAWSVFPNEFPPVFSQEEEAATCPTLSRVLDGNRCFLDLLKLAAIFQRPMF